jgi:hypothetical protein
MKRFKIDFIEFAFLVEACIPPRPIARTYFWHQVIDKYYHDMTKEERNNLYEWINKNPQFEEAKKKEHDAYLFELRFNPDNQYEVETEHEGKKEKHQCFKVNDRYYTKRNTSIVDEYITDVKKI